MKASELLRKAAQLIAIGKWRGGGCGALIQAAQERDDDRYRAKYKFFNLMKPGDGVYFYWWDFTPDDHAARIIGLCLAAAIAESEGD